MSDFDSQLAQAQAALGDQEVLQSVWGNALADTRRIDRTRQPMTATRTGTRAQLGQFRGGIGGSPDKIAKAANEVISATTTERQDRYAGDLLGTFYNRSRTDTEGFKAIQQKLFLGGFYRPGVRMDEIQQGVPDDYTMDAYYELLKSTLRYNESGADLTVEELLEERANSLVGALREKLGGGGGSGRIIQLADPAAVAQALDDVARQTVGRKATADEQRMFIASFHAAQSAAQSATSGTVVNPDVGAQAELAMREQNPTEAGAHDMAKTFDDFLSLIGGMGR